ncbi:MAG TPA: hypothetical protein VGQ76_02965, partial [Thermoanaerobaculia bacterium]|nr:hypothetical protein [Thermoanaerobaculia bacterium]
NEFTTRFNDMWHLFEVTAEDFRHQTEVVAESAIVFREHLDLRIDGLEQEMRAGFAEAQNLGHRVTILEESQRR